MDGDQQHDPAEIPRFLEKIEEGYDLVSGWRRSRNDHWLTRQVPSRIANWLMPNFPESSCTISARHSRPTAARFAGNPALWGTPPVYTCAGEFVGRAHHGSADINPQRKSGRRTTDRRSIRVFLT